MGGLALRGFKKKNLADLAISGPKKLLAMPTSGIYTAFTYYRL
jgi:hypothetical protein